MSNKVEHNEQQLLLRIARGDGRAFREFYNAHWNNVYTIALLYLKDALAAQDAVQDVFEKFWTSRTSLQHIDNPGGYLYVTTRNYLISRLRKKAAEYDYNMEMILHIPEQGPSPDRLLYIKEVAEAIERAVSALPVQQKKVFQLSRNQEIPLREVASQLNISYTTAREYMSLALKSIRKYLVAHLNELPVIVALFLL
ncbi:RNA polymerase sigma factor [Chitinophaga sp. 22321]|uniref:RNA polymerase sigma-70 factor n=1 Tax=Chitinophaga hostae TaxID=2831022 RepID=A0ABS5IZ45_9BACT|nr:RNA polymerase sigma-70 factor [Chitinophaga hostae]MBS0028235.1 RNA polymerase sigma-70 factor [Chitinophaga hostae]